MYGLIQFGGVLGTFVAVFVSVRTWAWATQADWLRSDWHTAPAWVRWLMALSIFAPRDVAQPPTMFRHKRLADLVVRCEAARDRMEDRYQAAWRDREHKRMRALEARWDILDARRETIRAALWNSDL